MEGDVILMVDATPVLNASYEEVIQVIQVGF